MSVSIAATGARDEDFTKTKVGGGPKVPLCVIENFRAGHAIGVAFRGRRRTGSAPGDRAPFLSNPNDGGDSPTHATRGSVLSLSKPGPGVEIDAKAEMPGVERDRRIDVVDDAAHAHGRHRSSSSAID